MADAIVIGYGSIGQRHTKILRSLGLEVCIVSRRPVEGERSFSSIADALRAGPEGGGVDPIPLAPGLVPDPVRSRRHA